MVKWFPWLLWFFRCVGLFTPTVPQKPLSFVVNFGEGIVKENMFVDRRRRRRLQALLGRGMADDGRSARLTMMAETCGRWGGQRRDETRSGDGPYRTRSGDGPDGT